MRKLTFNLLDTSVELELIKLDRKKLYGWSETIALDSSGEECSLVSYHPPTSTIIPKGSTTNGNLDSTGNWVDKSELKAVDEDGIDAVVVPSSFDAPIDLKDKVSLEEFLNHKITSVYSIQGEAEYPAFVEAIRNSSEIYFFNFNYRKDYAGSPAFIFEQKGELFIQVGEKMDFTYSAFKEIAVIDEDEYQEEIEEIDFSMM